MRRKCKHAKRRVQFNYSAALVRDLSILLLIYLHLLISMLYYGVSISISTPLYYRVFILQSILSTSPYHCSEQQ